MDVRALLLLSALALACDKPRADDIAKEQPAAAPSDGEAKVPSDEPAVVNDEPKPSDEPKPTEPKPTDEPTPSEPTIESLAASVERADDPSATGWTHLKAKQYAAALPYFAQASLAEPSAWKHPYNLACAAALAGDPAIAQLGLRAAVARDREATASKARRDADLASVREQPWFEATLRGEPTHEDLPSAPSVDAKPLSKAQLEPLLAALEAKHGVRPRVRASLTHSEDGHTLAWALYSVAHMDVCLKTSTKPKCAAKLRGEPDEGDFDQTTCGEEYLVAARMGDSLTLAEPRALKLPCKIAKVRRFELADVDTDGKLEVALDVTGRRSALGMHETELSEAGREVRILRLDDTVQWELTVEWTISEIAPGYERAQTFSWTDENADGHSDLFLETKEFVGIADLHFDDALWLTDEVDEEAVGPYSSQLRYYDPAKDEWGPPIAGP